MLVVTTPANAIAKLQDIFYQQCQYPLFLLLCNQSNLCNEEKHQTHKTQWAGHKNLNHQHQISISLATFPRVKYHTCSAHTSHDFTTKSQPNPLKWANWRPWQWQKQISQQPTGQWPLCHTWHNRHQSQPRKPTAHLDMTTTTFNTHHIMMTTAPKLQTKLRNMSNQESRNHSANRPASTTLTQLRATPIS